MRGRKFCALMIGWLTSAAGCTSQSHLTDAAIGGLGPRTANHFRVAAAAQPSQPPASMHTKTVVQVAAEQAQAAAEPEARSGRHPALSTARAASKNPAGEETILLASQSNFVPPAPASESQPAESDDARISQPVVPPSAGKPIDLGSALALVAGQNPSVSFARAQVREAYARSDRAEVLWMPDLQVGANYHRHDGTYQDVLGQIVDVNRSSLNAGLGTGATGAGTIPVPGVVMDFHLTDAIFGPEIARRSVWATQHAVNAEINDQLLNVALAYLALIEAEQGAAIVRQTLETADDLVAITADFARTGQGLQADAERAVTEQRLRQNERLRAEEDIAVASARLATLIRLNPAERLTPIERIPLPIELVDPACGPRDLVAQALVRRPELRRQRALVGEAVERLKREKYAPLVPSVLIGASYSGFGGGLGDTVAGFQDRADFDAMAFWEVRNLGFGERAARNEASARIEQARFRELRAMDEVARDVVEAHAQVAARAPQVKIADEATASAQRSYELSQQRIRDAQGLPIEALQALQALDVARREYLRAVTSYNEAQFRLHRALGWPIQG